MKKGKNMPMSKQSMWNVATEAVVNYLMKNGYKVDSATAKCTTYPNIVDINNKTPYITSGTNVSV